MAQAQRINQPYDQIQRRLALRHQCIERVYGQRNRLINHIHPSSSILARQKQGLNEMLRSIRQNNPARIATECGWDLADVLRIDYALPCPHQ